MHEGESYAYEGMTQKNAANGAALFLIKLQISDIDIKSGFLYFLLLILLIFSFVTITLTGLGFVLLFAYLFGLLDWLALQNIVIIKILIGFLTDISMLDILNLNTNFNFIFSDDFLNIIINLHFSANRKQSE
jgi:hypothetical protein